MCNAPLGGSGLSAFSAFILLSASILLSAFILQSCFLASSDLSDSRSPSSASPPLSIPSFYPPFPVSPSFISRLQVFLFQNILLK